MTQDCTKIIPPSNHIYRLQAYAHHCAITACWAVYIHDCCLRCTICSYMNTVLNSIVGTKKIVTHKNQHRSMEEMLSFVQLEDGKKKKDMKEMCCVSKVQLLPTQTWANVKSSIHVRLSHQLHVKGSTKFSPYSSWTKDNLSYFIYRLNSEISLHYPLLCAMTLCTSTEGSRQDPAMKWPHITTSSYRCSRSKQTDRDRRERKNTIQQVRQNFSPIFQQSPRTRRTMTGWYQRNLSHSLTER